MRIGPGSTDVSVYFYIVQDASATSPGEPVTGLLFSDIETGGSASYARQGAARVDLTLITLASASAAHADGGFILVDDTNMPGLYRCDYPDAAFASGVDQAMLQIVVASAKNAVASPIFVDLSSQQTGDSFARLGTPTDTDIATDIANVQSDTDDIQTRLPAALVSGLMDANVGAISGDVTAADNLEAGYDTTGLTGDNFPAKQSQVSNLTNSGAATNAVVAEDNTGGAIKGVTFVGVQTGVFSATKPLDLTYHVIDDTTNAIDVVYGFDVGGAGIPTSATWTGFLGINNDSIQVFGYDFVAVAWIQIGAIDGKNQVTNEVNEFDMFTDMVGTSGADTGKVYLRFEETGQSASFSLNTDQLFVSYATVSNALGYEGGAVWLSTVSGVAGTVFGANGTITNPSDSIADARTIADAGNLRIIHSLPGSSYTLAQSFDVFEFLGAGYTVALGGQSVSGANFRRAKITGNDDGSNAVATIYNDCQMMGNSLGLHFLHDCGIDGDMALAEAGDCFWDECYSAVAGTGAPSVDFEAAIETKNLSIRHYSGGMEYKNFGNLGTHTSSLEGFGQVILNANCAGGTLAVRGTFTVTDNASGAVTLSDDARYDGFQAADFIWDEELTGSTHNITNSAGKILRQVQEGGFQNASVWIDTSVAPGGDGTINDPADDITAALVIAAATGYHTITYKTGSSDTLVAAVEEFCIQGFGYTLALGGQSLSKSRIHNASLSGISTGAVAPEFRKCAFGSATIPAATLRSCSFAGSMVFGTGDYFFDKCFSAVAGTGSPDFDFGVAVGNTNVSFRHYSGGAEIKNMGGAGVDNMSLEGTGQLIINANCSGGTVAIRGAFTVTDNAAGAVTLSDDARYDVDQVGDAVADEALSGHTTAGTLGKAITDIEVDTADMQPKLGTPVVTISDDIAANQTDLDQIIADIAALNDLSAAQVNAEMVDVIAVDTYAEPSAVPGATATLADKISWIASLGRNKLTQTSTQFILRNDGDTLAIGTAPASDDSTTAIRGKFV